LPPLEKKVKKKAARKLAYAERAFGRLAIDWTCEAD
jgi:folate-dependent tRNA-U54 methylase TrmFO/GidA